MADIPINSHVYVFLNYTGSAVITIVSILKLQENTAKIR